MTEPRPRIPQPSGEPKADIQAIFRDFQPKRGRIFKAVPLAIEVDEGEVVWHDDEAGTIRGYIKLNNALRYWNLT